MSMIFAFILARILSIISLLPAKDKPPRFNPPPPNALPRFKPPPRVAPSLGAFALNAPAKFRLPPGVVPSFNWLLGVDPKLRPPAGEAPNF